MIDINPKIEASWKAILFDEFQSEYFTELKSFLQKENETEIVFPPSDLIFSAFDKTPFDKVKVVVLGQDPYHGEDQAHGLCFSVPKGIKQPPSLKNIFKELATDIVCKIPTHGNLEN